MNVQQRLERWIDKTADGSCWIWKGPPMNTGYGLINIGGSQQKLAHRVSFEVYKRPLLPGETVDHLCMVRNCVNPEHLDACSIGENNLRSPNTVTGRNSRKTHCPAGHELAGDNLMKSEKNRKCRECDLRRKRERYRRSKLVK